MNNPLPTDSLAMDEETFQLFYEQTARGVWRYVFVNCHNEAISDDVVQDTYIRFLQYVNPQRSFREQRAYLYRIAGTMLISHLRQNHPKTGESELKTLKIPVKDHNMAMDMQTAMAAVAPKERKLLWLAHVDGFSHSEIAEILGVAEPSVRVLLHRARKKLRSLLEKQGLNQEVRP